MIEAFERMAALRAAHVPAAKLELRIQTGGDAGRRGH
jgi:hypothetical protein